MRNLISIFSLLIFATVILSCGKDEEKENVKFVGKFVGVVNCDDETDIATSLDITAQANSSNKVNVTLDSDDDIVLMTGTVNGNSIVLDKVTVEDEIFLSGSGTLSGKVLTVAFLLEEGIDQGICDFVGTK